jgi:microcystin-dependent protein
LSDPFIGQIVCFAGPRSPGDSWIPCDGRLVSRIEFGPLFAVIGTTYGEGDMAFRVPDLRGAFPVGCGNGVKLGASSGASSVHLQAQHLPSHSHSLRAAAGGTGPTEAIQSGRAATHQAFHPTPIDAAGGADAVPTMPPYVTFGYYIASDGIFPPSGE